MLVLLIPIIFIGFFGIHFYTQSVEVQTAESTLQMINQVSENIDLYIKKNESVIDYLSWHESVLKFMNIESLDDPERILLEMQIREILDRVVSQNDEIQGILLVNNYSHYISNEIYRIKRRPLTDEMWFKQASLNIGRIQIFSTPLGRNLSNSLGYSSDDTVSLVKAVYEPETSRVLGALLIDLDRAVFSKLLNSISLGKSGCIFIIDSEGTIVDAPVTPLVYRIKKEWLVDNPRNVTIKTILNEKYQILYSVSDYTNWKTAGAISLNESLHVVVKMRRLIILSIAIVMIFTLLLSMFFSFRISNPIKELKILMKKVEKGDLYTSYQYRHDDEIGELGNSFNTMVVQIRNLINMVVKEQKKIREAEIRILHEQIKPHFLYNTLGLIQNMADEHNNRDISDIIVAVSRLFRISLSKGRELIPLEEEIEHVRSYLFILKARYSDKFRYRIINSVEDRCHILKFTLQPLAENAFYHGIKQKRGFGELIIKIGKSGSALRISVYDNGCGISEGKQSELHQVLFKQTGTCAESGYGIFNVNERIRLNFGEPYGLRFISRMDRGTVFWVDFPLLDNDSKFGGLLNA